MTYTADQQNIAAPATRPTGDKLENELRAALEHARRLTGLYSTGTPEVAVAWDVVEELLAAKARRREKAPSSFESYCSLNPNAPECRVYDV
ncbi:MAG TPA: Calvin cycle protein CP12 [Leptolyngbyaceae cyanobacterium]